VVGFGLLDRVGMRFRLASVVLAVQEKERPVTPTLITWVDAQADAEQWTARADLERTSRIIRTVGYDLGELIPDHVTLASSWDTSTQSVGHVMHIPEACVITRTPLEAT
jgi:hypothetical protein